MTVNTYDRRKTAAYAAQNILGNAAGADAVVRLAAFLLGEGDAQPATATAEPTPVADAGTARFSFTAGEDSTGACIVERFNDGSVHITVNGRGVGLGNEDSAELTRKFRS